MHDPLIHAMGLYALLFSHTKYDLFSISCAWSSGDAYHGIPWPPMPCRVNQTSFIPNAFQRSINYSLNTIRLFYSQHYLIIQD